MGHLKEKYLIDENGERIGVFLEMDEYQRILVDLEELDELRAFDHAIDSGEVSIPFDKAIDEIDRRRHR